MRLFHGTSSSALASIFESGVIIPATPNPITGVKDNLTAYVKPELISDELIETIFGQGGSALTYTSHQQTIVDKSGAVFFYHSMESFKGHAQCYVSKDMLEAGGEFALGVLNALRNITGLSITSKYEGAQPIILEVDTIARDVGGEYAHSGPVSADRIRQVHLLSEDKNIVSSMDLDTARAYCACQPSSRRSLLSNLGFQQSRNNAFYNAFIKHAPEEILRSNYFGNNASFFLSQAGVYASQFEVPICNRFALLETIAHFKGETTVADTLSRALGVKVSGVCESFVALEFPVGLDTSSRFKVLLGDSSVQSFIDKGYMSRKYCRLCVPYASMIGPLGESILPKIESYSTAIKEMSAQPRAECADPLSQIAAVRNPARLGRQNLSIQKAPQFT